MCVALFHKGDLFLKVTMYYVYFYISVCAWGTCDNIKLSKRIFS